MWEHFKAFVSRWARPLKALLAIGGPLLPSPVKDTLVLCIEGCEKDSERKWIESRFAELRAQRAESGDVARLVLEELPDRLERLFERIESRYGNLDGLLARAEHASAVLSALLDQTQEASRGIQDFSHVLETRLRGMDAILDRHHQENLAAHRKTQEGLTEILDRLAGSLSNNESRTRPPRASRSERVPGTHLRRCPSCGSLMELIPPSTSGDGIRLVLMQRSEPGSLVEADWITQEVCEACARQAWALWFLNKAHDYGVTCWHCMHQNQLCPPEYDKTPKHVVSAKSPSRPDANIRNTQFKCGNCGTYNYVCWYYFRELKKDGY